METTTLKSGQDKRLRSLLETAANTIGETLSSLVGRDIGVKLGKLQLQSPDAVLEDLPRPCAVARGAMDKEYAGKSFLTAFEMPDAIAMAGLLMMTPDDVINDRRQADALEGEDIEAFGELGNVLYSGFSNVLRERISNFDMRMQDQGRLVPLAAESDLLPADRLVTLAFRMKVGEFPESTGFVAIDAETAEKWNGGPLSTGEATPPPAEAPNPTKSIVAGRRLDDEILESIPAAPIRGVLAAYVLHGDVFRILRRSCRRVGLELRRHGRGEIPNPAAHRNEIVVLDVPPGEERRLDWCRRIKELSSTTAVVLLIRHPSRQRVTQAFLSRADAILGFPCEEAQLSQKLEPLLPEETPDDGADDES